jgi:hypothetical protein
VGTMQQTDIAIAISLVSAFVAAISLGWNIYRDVILKPKVVVTLAIKNLISAGTPKSPDMVGISAVNHGPGSIIINSITLKETSVWKRILRKEQHAFLVHDYTNPYSDKLPKKLDVGETLNLFGPFDKECFSKHPFTHLGLADSFGRVHWAKRKSMARIRSRWIEKYESPT